MLIGVALGFALQILFDAVSMGGQLLANSMGLSFAFNVDPMRGTSTPALGQLYALLVMLTFLALDGHLALIEMLVDGFRTLPSARPASATTALWTLVAWGTQIFAGALAVALPGITALLIVNLAFGVMSRAAPTLNLFAVGFPISLVFGLVIVLVGLPGLQSSFVALLGEAFAAPAQLLRRELTPWPRTTQERTEQPTQKRLDEARKQGPGSALAGAERGRRRADRRRRPAFPRRQPRPAACTT